MRLTPQAFASSQATRRVTRLRAISGSIIVASLSHGLWNGIAYVFFGFGIKVGALGITNTAMFGPEIGFLGLFTNLVFAVILWRWWKARLHG